MEFAPEYDFSLCIIPLMHTVKISGYDVNARLAAGLAMFDMISARGDYATARKAKIEVNPRIKKIFVAMTYEKGLVTTLD